MALYGMPRSGFDWDNLWGNTVEFIGCVRILDTEGSMWVFRSNDGHFAVITLYVDDGCIIWINGQEVARRHVAAGEMRHDSTSGSARDAGGSQEM